MHVINNVMNNKRAYNAIQDFAPVMLLVRLPFVMGVPTALNVTPLRDFVAMAKANPRKLNFATPEPATSVFLLGEDFQGRASIELNVVPYTRGGSQITQALMTNEAQATMLPLQALRAGIDAGSIKALAVTGDKRLPELPPPLSEAGYLGFEFYSWLGIFVRAGTAPRIVKRLHDEIAAIVAEPDIRRPPVGFGFDVVASSPENLRL